MSPQAEAVTERLDNTWLKWWVFSLLTGVVLTVAGAFGLLLVFALADALIHLPRAGLVTLFLVWAGLTATAVGLLIVRTRRGQRSLAATARRVELEFPELGSHLINLVQFAETNGRAADPFREAAVAQAIAEVGDFEFEKAAVRENRRRRFLLCMQTPRDLMEASSVLAGVVAFAFLLHLLMPGQWSSSVHRLLEPWKFVPAAGSVRIVKVTPGDTEVLVGASLEVAAEIENPAHKAYPATLFVRKPGEPESAQQLVPDEENLRFVAALPQVLGPLHYRLEIGNSQTQLYTVGVRAKPTVAEVEITYNYPPYLDRPRETVKQKHGDLEGPQFTLAELAIHPPEPVAGGYLQVEGRRVNGTVADDGRTLLAYLLLQNTTTYTIHLFSDAGHTDPEPRINQVRVTPDAPPTVQIVEPVQAPSLPEGAARGAGGPPPTPAIPPGKGVGAGGAGAAPASSPAPGEGTGRGPARAIASSPQPSPPGREGRVRGDEGAGAGAALGSKLSIVVKAGDDYGLGLVRLEMKQDEESNAGRPVETLTTWTRFATPTSALLHHELLIDQNRFKPGQTILIRAVAQDRRSLDIDFREIKLKLQPQEASTPWHPVRVIAREAKSAKDLAQLETIRAALLKILQQQTKARVATAGVPKQKAPDEAHRLAGEVRAQQVEIQKATVAVVESIGKTDDEEQRTIKRATNKLAFGHMLNAVRQSETLTHLKKVAQLPKPAAALTATQDQIIDVLRRLLNETRRDAAELMAEMEKRGGEKLPPDVQNKLREMKDKLDEFLKRQKKVIEATENLAKMPVDDFTEKEKQLLKDLAAKEDDWSRFMADLHSDLSKLPEQDFSNPSMLEEMVEVQTELKMAADALTKKSADIAVPLEQLGAEMAKELTTNIEKWLPDTPDREKWSQEEPLTDDMKEAPMAELPGELEDIVGDLMEQEEDLFDEMEDVSSSWADSIDKGAGWDAMDGPISNNSAKGVTGNRLPNSSEIAGRSGEGRQGKSSGEFVGDSAVGKGGRKTPSRLTPDANVKGQVKDHSKDPVGGATGGGKESGQGGEGLEGPVPKQKERSLSRLAGKQAELRNKAEGVNLKFQVLNYHHTDLKKLIETMSSVEQDLRSGRYQNALRRREVLLEGLGQVKTYLKGEFTIRRDDTANLPADIQKEILGSMQEASPAGWDNLNRQYFERLATAGARPAKGGQSEKPRTPEGKEAGRK